MTYGRAHCLPCGATAARPPAAQGAGHSCPDGRKNKGYMMIAERVRGITPFLAMEVLERAQKLEREGASIIHLELGEPDFDTPECIRQAAFKALDEGQTHYTHSLGDVELREHLCA